MQKTESQQMKNHHNWKRTVFFCLLIKIVWVGFTPRLTTAILFPMATESNSLWSEVDIRPTKDPILLSAFFFRFGSTGVVSDFFLHFLTKLFCMHQEIRKHKPSLFKRFPTHTQAQVKTVKFHVGQVVRKLVFVLLNQSSNRQQFPSLSDSESSITSTVSGNFVLIHFATA